MFKKFFIGILAAAVLVMGGAGVLPAQAAPAASLTSDESAGLLFMYEEEKLARDVYTLLYETWGASIFQSIAASEQAHMDAVAQLLVNYGLTVPGSTPGIYNDTTLAALYADLVADGRLSLADAYKVGAMIEEVDIQDLNSRLAQASASDIQLVYNNLLKGSYNHLRAFTRALLRQAGETYQPQVLSQELYDTILAGKSGYGNGFGGSVTSGTTGRGARIASTPAGNGTCSGTCDLDGSATGTRSMQARGRGGR